MIEIFVGFVFTVIIIGIVCLGYVLAEEILGFTNLSDRAVKVLSGAFAVMLPFLLYVIGRLVYNL